MALSIIPQDQIAKFIYDLTDDYVSQGSLYGILFTGLSNDCIDLFQKYIDRTNDIQTVALSIINASKLPNHVSTIWIEAYRDLLDKWMLWEQRALFDIKRKIPLEPQIYIPCRFCGENISTRVKKLKHTGEKQSFNLSMTCQSCQKPLPKCTICSLYMSFDVPKSNDKEKLMFAFVICQLCSHGGHLAHLNEWFL